MEFNMQPNEFSNCRNCHGDFVPASNIADDTYLSMTKSGTLVHKGKTKAEVVQKCKTAIENNVYEYLEIYKKVSIVKTAKTPIVVIEVK
jgi:hypothetical protein